jgi:hypothetical protein
VEVRKNTACEAKQRRLLKFEDGEEKGKQRGRRGPRLTKVKKLIHLMRNALALPISVPLPNQPG